MCQKQISIEISRGLLEVACNVGKWWRLDRAKLDHTFEIGRFDLAVKPINGSKFARNSNAMSRQGFPKQRHKKKGRTMDRYRLGIWRVSECHLSRDIDQILAQR